VTVPIARRVSDRAVNAIARPARVAIVAEVKVAVVKVAARAGVARVVRRKGAARTIAGRLAMLRRSKARQSRKAIAPMVRKVGIAGRPVLPVSGMAIAAAWKAARPVQSTK
jgi:hypothetical protein